MSLRLPGENISLCRLATTAADKEGNIDTSTIVRIITGIADVKPKPKSVKISEETFYKYFEPGTKKAQVTETVEKALAFYFANVESEA